MGEPGAGNAGQWCWEDSPRVRPSAGWTGSRQREQAAARGSWRLGLRL